MDEHIEYKPFIQPNDPKENEVIETVVAFANTGGGRLYIGAHDDGVPQGQSALCAAGKAAPEEAIETLMNRLKKIIREKVKPVPNIEVKELSVFDERVIFILIIPGEETPYSTHENDVYIRKGSTNMKPDPKTELPQLYKETHREDTFHSIIPRGTFYQ